MARARRTTSRSGEVVRAGPPGRGRLGGAAWAGPTRHLRNSPGALAPWAIDSELPYLSMRDVQSPIAFLRSPHAIRQRAAAVFEAGLAGELTHFQVELGALPRVIERVAQVTRRRYPDLRVPWPSRLTRMKLGGHDRLAPIRARFADDVDERARVLLELALVSILLGAGAGDRWRYHERETGIEIGRTEGLALASLAAYRSGLFSADPGAPLRVDADALDALDPFRFAKALDVRPDNPMEGLTGRTELVSQVGSAMRAATHVFVDGPRLGRLYDALVKRARRDASGRRAIPARRILALLLEVFSPIWPSRHVVMGVSVGDTWPHPKAGGSGPSAGLVPFHTFAQWMTYSLIPIFEEAGLAVTDVAELPGLTEYRTCGLFLDDGVLVPRHAEVVSEEHEVGSELVVEWRALSLSLLAKVAHGLSEALDLSGDAVSAACVIEGGTWTAGRDAAKERRASGAPPIRVRREGTVF